MRHDVDGFKVFSPIPCEQLGIGSVSDYFRMVHFRLNQIW